MVQAVEYRHEALVSGGQCLAYAFRLGDVGHGCHPADLLAVRVAQRRDVHACGETGTIAALSLDFQSAAGRAARKQDVQCFLMLGMAARQPIGEGRGAADKIGFVPTYHAAKSRVDRKSTSEL